jgi:hypothetical protein
MFDTAKDCPQSQVTDLRSVYHACNSAKIQTAHPERVAAGGQVGLSTTRQKSDIRGSVLQGAIMIGPRAGNT